MISTISKGFNLFNEAWTSSQKSHAATVKIKNSTTPRRSADFFYSIFFFFFFWFQFVSQSSFVGTPTYIEQQKSEKMSKIFKIQLDST